MKILLDENLPRKLKFQFSENHQIFTVRDKNWNGKKNGELLGLMTLDGFDGFVTIDKISNISKTSPDFLSKFLFSTRRVIKSKRLCHLSKTSKKAYPNQTKIKSELSL